MSLALEWGHDENLTDPWPNFLGVGVVVVYGHVTSKCIHRLATILVLLKTATDGGNSWCDSCGAWRLKQFR